MGSACRCIVAPECCRTKWTIRSSRWGHVAAPTTGRTARQCLRGQAVQDCALGRCGRRHVEGRPERPLVGHRDVPGGCGIVHKTWIMVDQRQPFSVAANGQKFLPSGSLQGDPRRSERTAPEEERCCIEKLTNHLADNGFHYKKAVWLHEDPNERAVRFRGIWRRTGRCCRRPRMRCWT